MNLTDHAIVVGISDYPALSEDGKPLSLRVIVPIDARGLAE